MRRDFAAFFYFDAGADDTRLCLTEPWNDMYFGETVL